MENIDINSEGGVLVVSSNLTGHTWDGGLTYFTADANLKEELACSRLSKEMFVSLADGAWIDATHAVVATDNGSVDVLTLEDGQFVDPVEAIQHHSFVTSVSVFADGTSCVSGSDDYYVCTADVREGKLLRKYLAHGDTVNQVTAHNASPHMLASCSMDGTVLVWDSRNPKPARKVSVSKDTATSVCYHGNKLAVGTQRGELLIKDLRASSHLPLKSVSNHSRPITRIKFSPSREDLLATCGEDGLVAVVNYNLLNTQAIYTDSSHTDFVTGLVWRSDNSLLSCSWDSSIHMHSTDSSASNSPAVCNGY